MDLTSWIPGMNREAKELRDLPRTMELETRCDIKAVIQGDGEEKTPRVSMVVGSGWPRLRLSNFVYDVIMSRDGCEFDKPITPIVMDHDTSQRIGHTTAQLLSEQGIFAEGVVSSTSDTALSFVADAKRKYPFQASVGATIESAVFVREGESMEINGRTEEGPFVAAIKTRIKEISVTVLGADSGTSVHVAASASNEGSFQMAKATEVNGVNDSIARERELRAAEGLRCDQIEATAKRYSGLKAVELNGQSVDLPTLKAEAIRSGMSPAEFELECRRSELPSGGSTAPAFHMANRDFGDDVLEAAVARHAGLDHGALYGDQIAAAADSLQLTSLFDAAALCVRASGRHCDMRNKDAVITAAFSTSSFSAITSNVASKQLLDSYGSVPSVARMLAAKVPVNDFKEHTIFRMTGAGTNGINTLQPIGSDGNIKHTQLSDDSVTAQADTAALMVGLTRKHIINDDTGALSGTPRRLGRMAALTLEGAFWTKVIGNANSFFGEGNSNYLTDALDADGLSAGVQLFLEQTDQDGKPINVAPRYLVTPPSLKTKADELFVSRAFNVGGGDSTDTVRATNGNAFMGLYEPLCSPWLGANGGLSGSNTGWYLFGNPADVPAFGICYLGGNEQPIIEMDEAPFHQTGIQWRVIFDFGIVAIDPRGAIHSTGAGA